jgi:hypothetical protein
VPTLCRDACSTLPLHRSERPSSAATPAAASRLRCGTPSSSPRCASLTALRRFTMHLDVVSPGGLACASPGARPARVCSCSGLRINDSDARCNCESQSRAMHDVIACTGELGRLLHSVRHHARHVCCLHRRTWAPPAQRPTPRPSCLLKVKAKLGGRVRLLTTGASPIGPDVMAFLRVCFPGAVVLEGYGALCAATRGVAACAASVACARACLCEAGARRAVGVRVGSTNLERAVGTCACDCMH